MITLEFRDGERDIPDHLAAMMKGIRTWEMTFDEAKVRAETQMTRNFIETAQRDLLRKHFNDGTT